MHTHVIRRGTPVVFNLGVAIPLGVGSFFSGGRKSFSWSAAKFTYLFTDRAIIGVSDWNHF